MQTIMQLAEQYFIIKRRVAIMGIKNRPVDIKEQIKDDVAYKLATDALARCEKEYRDALNAMTTTDLINLTK